MTEITVFPQAAYGPAGEPRGSQPIASYAGQVNTLGYSPSKGAVTSR